MRIFFSVGEPSGDLHGANLIADLRKLNPGIESVGFGGPRMKQAGCQALFDLTTLAVMGLWNVLLNLRRFVRLLATADRYLSENHVDAVVLIDYPGFNWSIARRAKRRGIPVFYYGPPQMWAWAPWRVRKLKRLVDHVLCKLPFEEAWFRRRGVTASWVGHPYFDELVRYQANEQFMRDYDDPSNRLLVLLPGSRTQEVTGNLPWLLEAARRVLETHPDTAVAVACFSEAHARLARELCRERQLPFDVMSGRTPELVGLSTACMACSGSVSLELLYHRKPTVIVYRVGLVTQWLSRLVLRTPFITLVNLLATDGIDRAGGSRYDPDSRERTDVPFPEYLTCRDCSPNLAGWVNEWFDDGQALSDRRLQLDALARQFAVTGGSERAAQIILERVFANSGEPRSANCQFATSGNPKCAPQFATSSPSGELAVRPTIDRPCNPRIRERCLSVSPGARAYALRPEFQPARIPRPHSSGLFRITGDFRCEFHASGGTGKRGNDHSHLHPRFFPFNPRA